MYDFAISIFIPSDISAIYEGNSPGLRLNVAGGKFVHIQKLNIYLQILFNTTEISFKILSLKTTVFGLVLFLNFRFFRSINKPIYILSYCSDWFCRKLSLKSSEGMKKKYYFYDFICQFDRSCSKLVIPKANTKHSHLKHLSHCYINRTCSKLTRNCRKPLKSSVSGIRALKDHKTATPIDKTRI